MLILERPWTRQPQTAVPAAGSGFSRLTYGPHLGGIDGTLWTPQNAPSVIASPEGQARRFTSGSAQAIRTSISGINSNNVTLFLIAKKTTTTEANETLMSLSAASGNQRTLLYWAAGSGYLRLSIFVGNGASFRQAQTAQIADWTDTTSWYVFFGVVSDSANGLNCYYSKNNVEVASSITDSGTVTAGAPSAVSVGGYFNDEAYVANFYATMDVLVAGVLPYAVSEIERKFLTRDLNAWASRLQPRRIPIPTPAAATGYTHPTLSLATAIDVTATSFKPRVTYTFA